MAKYLREILPLDELSVFKMQGAQKVIRKRVTDEYKKYQDDTRRGWNKAAEKHSDKSIKHQVYGTERIDAKIKKKTGTYSPGIVHKVADYVSDKLKGRNLTTKKRVLKDETELDEAGKWRHSGNYDKHIIQRSVDTDEGRSTDVFDVYDRPGHKGNKKTYDSNERAERAVRRMYKEEAELDEGKYTYKTEGPKPSDKNPKWIERSYKSWEKAQKRNYPKQWKDTGKLAGKIVKKVKEETELDEAKRPVYKRKGSLRAQIKSQADINKEKAERRRTLRGAKREKKETGEKVQFAKFKNWRSVRKSAREKMEEELQELSLQRVGSFIDKATAQDYDRGSTKHRKGINLALRKRGEHEHALDVPPRVRASIDGKKR